MKRNPQVRKPGVTVRLKVPFFDVDPMQVVWHGHYLKYFDMARQIYAEKCGLDFYRHKEEKGFVFPVIRSTIKYIHPLCFGDEFFCKLELMECRIKIVQDFEIRLAESGKLSATGTTEQVALRMPEREMELAIPEEVQEALQSVFE